MTEQLLVYDVLLVECDKCGNWVEQSDADPRRKVNGYGFEFGHEDEYDFTCTQCNCKAKATYYNDKRTSEDEEPDLVEVRFD